MVEYRLIWFSFLRTGDIEVAMSYGTLPGGTAPSFLPFFFLGGELGSSSGVGTTICISSGSRLSSEGALSEPAELEVPPSPTS